MSDNTSETDTFTQELENDNLLSERGVAIDVTTRCNLNCTYCFCYIVKKKDELTSDELINLLSDLYDMGVDSVALSGGEPTLREDFMQITETIASWGMRFSLMTNGCLITKEQIEKLVPHLDSAGVSIDGPREIHNELRGGFDEAVQTLRHFAEFDIPITINSSVNSVNWEHLDYLVDLTLETGIDGLKVHPILRLDRNRAIEDKYFLPEELYEPFYNWLVEKSLETMGHCYIVTSLKPRKRILDHPCEAEACWGEYCHSRLPIPPRFLFIQANGYVMPSEVMPEEYNIGNIRKKPISQIVSEYFGSPDHVRFLNLHKYTFEKYVLTSDNPIIDWKQYVANEARKSDFEEYVETNPIQGAPSATSVSMEMDSSIDMRSAKPRLSPGVTFNEKEQTITLPGKEVLKINELTKKVIFLCNGENTPRDIAHTLEKDEKVGKNLKVSRIEAVIRFLRRMNIISVEGDGN